MSAVWQRELSKRVGHAVRAARGNMSAVELSAKCEKLGLPIHRTTLSKIEKGRSSFDLAELIVLARALDVPALSLIYPDDPRAAQEFVGDGYTPTAEVKLKMATMLRSLADDLEGTTR